MTDAPHVRRPALREGLAREIVRPIGGSSAPPPDPAPKVCRTTVVRVNLGRLLAELQAEARRLLGGALYE